MKENIQSESMQGWRPRDDESMYLMRLAAHLGRRGLAGLTDTCDSMIADETVPGALRNLLRIFRLMFREMNYHLPNTCERANWAMQQVREQQGNVDACQEALDLETVLWEEAAEKTRTLLKELQALDCRWTPLTRWEQLGARTAWPMELDVPTVPRTYTEYMEFFRAVRKERARLFEALNARLTANFEFEGVPQMEAFDEAFDMLHGRSLGRFEYERQICMLTRQRNEAGERYREANRQLYAVLEKMPQAGKVALTRLAQTLDTDEYADHRAAFTWLLLPPEPIVPGMPVIVIEGK